MSTSLRGPSLSKAVRQSIKEYIIDNNLSAGDMLPSEGQFAKELGVGRSSVREAVKALQSLGIVEVRHGNGLYVRELNFDPVLETLDYVFRFNTQSIKDLFQIRLWLESAVIGDAVQKISSLEIAELELIMLEWQNRVQVGRPVADLDERFHLTLYSVMGNQTLLKLIEVFWISFDNIVDLHDESHDSLNTLQAHKALFEAVKSRDSDLSRERLIETFDDLDMFLANLVINGA